jgi:peptide deformylase
MAKLEIVCGENNAILRAESVEVVKFDASLKKFVKDLKKLMAKAGGLGLAAPQVGVHMRIFVLILDFKKASEQVVAMINPRILSHGDEVEIAEEGCLSLPGLYANVERWRDVKVEFCDVDGGRQVLELSGLNARVVQHEYDHLDGVLFVDRVREREAKAKHKEEDVVM